MQSFTLICQNMTELQLFEIGPNLTMLAIGETAFLIIFIELCVFHAWEWLNWLRCCAGKQRVVGSKPVRGIVFYFLF